MKTMYVKPAVHSETMFEQTSLACTIISQEFNPGTLNTGCTTDITKGGNFNDSFPVDCEIILVGASINCAPSYMGTLLS